MGIKQLNKWIKQHGFKTTIHNTSIDVFIPFTTANGAKGEEIINVSTLKEARDALGY